MQDAEVKNSDGLVKFISLFKLSDLEQALSPYKKANNTRRSSVITLPVSLRRNPTGCSNHWGF